MQIANSVILREGFKNESIDKMCEQDNKNIILFLDFDGVLHPVGTRTAGEKDFSKLPQLEAWLRANPIVSVVISSSWRDCMSLALLQQFFSADLRSRIIDKCPILPFEPAPEFWRYAEIMAWIDQQQYRGKWLALDDAVDEFPPNFEQLIICDRAIGIDECVINELTKRILCD